MKSGLKTELSSLLTRAEESLTYWSYTGFRWGRGAGLLQLGVMLHTYSVSTKEGVMLHTYGVNTKEGEAGRLMQV